MQIVYFFIINFNDILVQFEYWHQTITYLGEVPDTYNGTWPKPSAGSRMFSTFVPEADGRMINVDTSAEDNLESVLATDFETWVSGSDTKEN